MPIHERLSQIVSINLIGLVLYLIIDLPVQKLNITILSSSTIVAVSLQFMAVLVLAGLAFTSVGVVLNLQSRYWLRQINPHWVNATLLVILAALTLVYLGSLLLWGIGLIITGVLLWGTLLATYHLALPQQTQPKLAMLWNEWIGYALFFGYGLLLYQTPMAGLIRIISLALVAFLLAEKIFHSAKSSGIQSHIFAWVIGWGMGYATWMLQLLGLQGVQIAALTTIIFYVFLGLSLAHFAKRLSGQTVMEYAFIAIIGSATSLFLAG